MIVMRLHVYPVNVIIITLEKASLIFVLELHAILVGRMVHGRYPIRVIVDVIYLLLLRGIELIVRPASIRLPANILYTPMYSKPLLSLPNA